MVQAIVAIDNSGQQGTVTASYLDASDLGLGENGPANFRWETADANANKLILELPTPGSVDVPVFIIGTAESTALRDRDLALFNGVEETTFGIQDSDGDTHLVMDYSADDAARIRTIGTTRDLTITPTGELKLSNSAGDLTITPADQLVVTATDAIAAAVKFTANSTDYYSFDTRTNAGVDLHVWKTAAITLASGSESFVRFARFNSFTLNYTGTSAVTTLIPGVEIKPTTIVGAAGLNITKASMLTVVAPIESTNITLADASAIRVKTATGTPTNNHGIYIEDQTVGATADYGITIEGSDTAAIWVKSADPIQLGTAGTATGTMNWQGSSSGVVTVTVAAAAGTWTLTLPPDNGSAGEQLQTNGSGVATWEAAGSLAAYKDVHGTLDSREALDAILESQTKIFTYRQEADDGSRPITTGDYDTQYAGVLGDDFPEVMHHDGKIFSPVTAFGYTVSAFHEMEKRLRKLEQQQGG